MLLKDAVAQAKTKAKYLRQDMYLIRQDINGINDWDVSETKLPNVICSYGPDGSTHVLTLKELEEIGCTSSSSATQLMVSKLLGHLKAK
jgi:hypothetical protein